MAGTTSGACPEAEIDAAFRLLADRSRRHLVGYLTAEESGVVTREELAGHLASRRPDARERQIRARLVHVHLPLLADAGLVDHDRRSGHVRYRGDDIVERVLEFLETDCGRNYVPNGANERTDCS